MKRMKNKLEKYWLLLLVLFFLPTIVFALNTWDTGYRVNHGGDTKEVIVGSADGNCYRVTNNHPSNDYFVPTKTVAEWDAFRISADSLPGISLAPCPAKNNKDVVLWEWHPNTNYGSLDHLTLRLDDWGSSRNDFVMEWTLPDDPGGATITAIKLHLWLYECSNEGTGGYSIGELHELKESIQSESGATWMSRGIDKWTNPGAWAPHSADPTVVDTVDFRIEENRNPGWKTWVLKGPGAEHPVSWNWGETHAFVVYDPRNIADGRSCRFYSKEASDPDKRPWIEIEYEK